MFHLSPLWVIFEKLAFHNSVVRSSHPDVFLRKGVLKTCSKFTGEHPRGSAISVKYAENLQENTHVEV